MNRTGKTICLIGQTGSGKSTVAGILVAEFPFMRVNVTDALRNYSEEIGFKSPTRAGLQMIANEARSQFGSGFFAERAMKQTFPEIDIVVEGIRHEEELKRVKENRGDTLVVGLESDQETRFTRILKRKKDTDPTTYEEFVSNDQREWGKNEDGNSQNTRRLMELIDVKIINSRELFELRRSIIYVLHAMGWFIQDPEVLADFSELSKNKLVEFKSTEPFHEGVIIGQGKER